MNGLEGGVHAEGLLINSLSIPSVAKATLTLNYLRTG